MKKRTIPQPVLQLEAKRLLLVGSLVLLTCLVVGYGLTRAKAPTQPQRMVTFYDRGLERSIVTTAPTVQDSLQAASIVVDPRDIIEPSADTALTGSRVDIIIYRSRPVAVIDGAIRQTIMTPRQSANDILEEVGLPSLDPKDESAFAEGNLLIDGAQTKLTLARLEVEVPAPQPIVFQPKPNALTKSKGAHVYVDSDGVAHRETYYDLPMNVVIRSCGAAGTYSIRSDGAKIDQDGYVLIAANLGAYPRCTIVDTSLGPGKVYDTGGFALRHPYGFDLATDWTRGDGI